MPTRQHYTRKRDVPKLKSGQTLGFTKGKGYYVKAPARKPAAAAKPEPKNEAPFTRPAPPAKPRGLLIREKLVRAEIAAAKLGIREVGGNNHGPWVKKFLAETGLPEGYAWCDAFQSYEEHQVAGMRLPIESASVANTYATAKALGWVVTRPLRGDLVCFNFQPQPVYGQFGDHIGIVVKVLRLGPTLILRTVEGNTSSGLAGSQADGGGVYLRIRTISRSRCGFVRIPGIVD